MVFKCYPRCVLFGTQQDTGGQEAMWFAYPAIWYAVVVVCEQNCGV